MRKSVFALTVASMLVALEVAVFELRSGFQPGPLLQAHQQLISDCTACHRPWRGPSNDGCVSCHGNLGPVNPHSDFDVSEIDIGLMAGKRLTVSADGNLECLSCHSEHQGAVINIRRGAGFACTWCHKHSSISAVSEHMVPEMRRRFSVRHLFERPFNHYEHKLLSESRHSPIARTFACTSCHTVVPVKPGQSERMSFKWAGCAGAGCHVTPQDSFMKMPASVGFKLTTIAYSGMVPVRHINAVFVHSAGHLQAHCEQCHMKVAASRNPDDADSLAIEQCFSCHAHQAVPARGQARATESGNQDLGRNVLALTAVVPLQQHIIACGDCHMFHVYGVVPLRDFETHAPAFPPKQRRSFTLTLYVPYWSSPHRPGTIKLRPVLLVPWWIGLLASAAIWFSLARFIQALWRRTKR